MNTINKAVLRPDEVAEILNISKRQVYNKAKKGELPIASRKPLRLQTEPIKKIIGHRNESIR